MWFGLPSLERCTATQGWRLGHWPAIRCVHVTPPSSDSQTTFEVTVFPPHEIAGPTVAAKSTSCSSGDDAIACTETPRQAGSAALVAVQVAPPSVERWWPSAPQVSTIVP